MGLCAARAAYQIPLRSFEKPGAPGPCGSSFHPRAWKAGASMSPRPASSNQRVPGQSEVLTEALDGIDKWMIDR